MRYKGYVNINISLKNPNTPFGKILLSVGKPRSSMTFIGSLT